MHFSPHHIELIARELALSTNETARLLTYGENCIYQSGDYLFHQSAPRQFFGVVLSGRLELRRTVEGRTLTLVCLTEGALVGETILIDDEVHGATCLPLEETELWVMDRDAIERLRREDQALYCFLVSVAARRISSRLGKTRDMLLLSLCTPVADAGFRVEHDSLGSREVADIHYYGIQTVRAVENFPFSGVRLSHFQHLIKALATVKSAAAAANAELGVLDSKIAEAIQAACVRVASGELHDQFVVDMVQGGAGTSTNMNANEVIANLSLEILGQRKGDYQHCHPNDHVNCSQSTNDAYPTAIKLAVYTSAQETVSALKVLRDAFRRKSEEYADVLKMGRTENQDAVPITLGQEFHAYSRMLTSGIRRIEAAAEALLVVNMGATAVGTGLNSPQGYAELCTAKLAELSHLNITLADDLVEATQDAGDFATMSGALKVTAIQISKICNDLRWASSGPRCGLGEITLPPLQPGSSIMPGKVNPVLPEVVNQICYQIIGSDLTISLAAEAGEFELNMAEPIMAYHLLNNLMLLKNAAITLTTRCIEGIIANRERCASYVKNSIGIVTALNPVLGYERSASIAKEALATGQSVYDLTLSKGWLTEAQLNDLLEPNKMADPLGRAARLEAPQN